MSSSRSLLIGIGIGVFIALIVVLSIFTVSKYNTEAIKTEQDGFVCKYVNMNVIAEAIRKYEQTHVATNLVTLKTLVDAKLLPEWSEIYICPGQFGTPILRSNYDDSFVSNIFTPSGIAANYAHGSYYIETLSNSFRIRCLYHTNILDVVIQK